MNNSVPLCGRSHFLSRLGRALPGPAAKLRCEPECLRPLPAPAIVPHGYHAVQQSVASDVPPGIASPGDFRTNRRVWSVLRAARR